MTEVNKPLINQEEDGMAPSQVNAWRNFRKILRSDKVNARTIDSYVGKEGWPQSIFGKKFAGFDHDYTRLMIYRVDSVDRGNWNNLIISELTANPRARTYGFISSDLHTRDPEVTGLDLKEVAKLLELPTDNFHFYV